MRFAQRRKRLCAFLFARARQRAGRGPGGIVAHPPEPLAGFSKQRVIQTSSGLQMSAQAVLLAPVYAQGQFEEKRRGLRSLHEFLYLLLGVLLLFKNFCSNDTSTGVPL